MMSLVTFTLSIEKSPGIISKVVVLLSNSNYAVKGHTLYNIKDTNHSKLILQAEGERFQEGLSDKLLSIDGVISMINIERNKNNAPGAYPSQTPHSKKQECKKILTNYFNEEAANCVDDMTEEDCVEICEAKIAGLITREEAKEAFKHIR